MNPSSRHFSPAQFLLENGAFSLYNVVNKRRGCFLPYFITSFASFIRHASGLKRTLMAPFLVLCIKADDDIKTDLLGGKARELCIKGATVNDIMHHIKTSELCRTAALEIHIREHGRVEGEGNGPEK